MVCSNEDRGRSRRPGAEDRGWSHSSGTRWPGGREVGCRRVRSAPSMWRLGVRVSWLSLKSRSTVCEWFGLKTTRTVSSGLASKLVATVSPGLTSNRWSVCWLSLKIKVVEGFPVWTSKPTATGVVIWASKSPRRFLGLGLKTKQALVCQLCNKTDGGRSASDTR
jgi:hypothetical protein